MLSKYIANMMTAPQSSPVFDTPADYGLDYEDVTFTTTDGFTLSGWLIKGGQDKVIIQSHFGIQCSRSGYTPKGKGLIKFSKHDVSFLRQAKHFVAQGYSVLMYDMRNHGNSQHGTGYDQYISWGQKEARDVIAAVDYITTHPEYTNAHIGLLSICMGASATTFAYGLEDGLHRYEAIKAIIAIQPLRYPHFMKAMGIPDWLANGANAYNQNRSGIDLMDSFFDHAPKIHTPTLVIQNQNDPWTNMDAVKEYHDLLGGDKELMWVDLAKNRGAAYDWIGTSPEAYTPFFDRHMGTNAE